MTKKINTLFICAALILISSGDDFCTKEKDSCAEKTSTNKYSKESNDWTRKLHEENSLAMENHIPCQRDKCNCFEIISDNDFRPFDDGITKEQFEIARARGTKYQIIDGKLYREKNCHFPARCDGIEHYLTALAPELPNMELAINTRDWPQLNKAWGQPKAPVFSFSKTQDYYDIMYPAWSFWEGGPAISLYPTGIGRWDEHRISISAAADKWPWEKKQSKAFLRGSRTSEERDALILLSRADPELVDAQYTKNQAWKSDADTLYAPPASEVSFEDHCKYKYLFNYRGVAASFRFKHLFLCKSLVFHVGDEWQEFFYPLLKPWVHYVPISPTAKNEEIKKYITFFKENDSLGKEIAERGYKDVWERLTDSNVTCYWKKILRHYASIVKYEVTKDKDVIRVL